MTTPNAPPVVRTDHVKVYKNLLINLFEHPQWGSMAEESRNRALDILKVAADTDLRSTELAHIEALTRNALVTPELRKGTVRSAETGTSADELDGVAAETRKIKAKTEKVKAEIALTEVQKERKNQLDIAESLQNYYSEY